MKLPKRVLRAQYLFSAAGASPLQRDAGVVVQGDRILATGDATSLLREHDGADVTDLGAAVLMPGLINGHAHLELTHLRAGPRPGSFVEWVTRLRATLGSDPDPAARALESIRAGVAESLRFGVTTVADLTNVPRLQRTTFGSGPLRLISFGEVRAMAQRRTLADAMIAAALERVGPMPVGVSPHAPYSVEPDVYRACVAAARRENLPIMTHLAELPYEGEFLASHAGPLRALWEHIGGWDDAVPSFAGGPIRFAESVGLLDCPAALLAHVNHCDDAELDLLALGRASVVYCPRTHRYFGHPPHRWREMLARGVNVTVGTDSTASSPDLNLVDDLRLLHAIAPDVPPHELWQLATTRAARALAREADLGRLAPGKLADLVVFNVTTADPLREILEDPTRRPSEVWVDGERVV